MFADVDNVPENSGSPDVLAASIMASLPGCALGSLASTARWKHCRIAMQLSITIHSSMPAKEIQKVLM